MGSRLKLPPSVTSFAAPPENAPDKTEKLRDFRGHRPRSRFLPMQFQTELELPRIICGGCTASIRPERIYVRDVKSIRDIEDVGAGLEI